MSSVMVRGPSRMPSTGSGAVLSKHNSFESADFTQELCAGAGVPTHDPGLPPLPTVQAGVFPPGAGRGGSKSMSLDSAETMVAGWRLPTHSVVGRGPSRLPSTGSGAVLSKHNSFECADFTLELCTGARLPTHDPGLPPLPTANLQSSADARVAGWWSSAHDGAGGRGSASAKPSSQGNLSPFGSRSPFGKAGHRSPFGSAGNRSPFGNAGNRSPFGNAGNKSPFGNAGNRSPFGNAGNKSPFGNVGNWSPFGSAESDGIVDEFGFQDAASKAAIKQYHNQSLYMKSRCEQWEIQRDDVTLCKKMGEGDFGGIYEAVWRRTKVSARIVENSSADEVMNELRIWSHIRHPNLVLFMGSVVKSEPFIIISEYMSGGTLQDRCLGSPAEWRQFALWSIDLARAITFLHNCHPPIVHGNLKPENLMINAGQHLCVSNFANSQVILKQKKRGKKYRAPIPHAESRLAKEPGDSSEEKYQEGARYASPEALAQLPVDDRTDIWSFAMVLFFMSSGMHPHQNLTIDKAVEVLLTCTPPDLSLTSFRAKVVTEVMTDATAKVPSARPTITQIFEKVKTWQDIKASAVGETHGKCECSVS